MIKTVDIEIVLKRELSASDISNMEKGKTTEIKKGNIKKEDKRKGKKRENFSLRDRLKEARTATDQKSVSELRL